MEIKRILASIITEQDTKHYSMSSMIATSTQSIRGRDFLPTIPHAYVSLFSKKIVFKTCKVINEKLTQSTIVTLTGEKLCR